ncbi:MAG: PAS domain S-box protein [Candidatus Omnitrophica bacterium]|nr:PAS domain S-box protein [Candidatus Omnitrophota bacterium]
MEQENPQICQVHEILYQIIGISLENITLKEMLEKTIDVIVSISWLSLESKGAIFLVEENPEVLVMKAVRGLSNELQKVCCYLPFGRCLCGRAAASKEIVFADCVDERHENVTPGIMPHGHYCVPILSDGQILGVINLYIKAGSIREQYKIDLLNSVANVLAGIIKRRKAEQALAESEKKYRLLAENASDVIWTSDLSLHYTYISPAITSLLGYTIEESLAMGIEKMLSPGSAESIKKAFLEEVEKENLPEKDLKRMKTLEVGLMHKDGHLVLGEVKAVFIRNEENIALGFLGVTRDITERKKIENSQRLAQLGKLVSDMAHEVNNPLMVIYGRAQLSLMLGVNNQGIENNLKLIMEQCDRAKTIIDRLLMFSKPSKGEMTLLNINDVVENTINLVEHQYKLKNVKIMRSYDKNLPAAKVDEKHMQEIFMNLLNNASEAMPEGGFVTVITSFNGANIQVDVTDTGSGIPDENLLKIFDPFFTTKEKGTGLGLSVCAGIIRAHGGDIKIRSKIGQGTTVSVFVPIEAKANV